MISLAEAQQLDARDPLAARRDKFALKPEQIYLDGNSLGAMPHAAKQQVAAVTQLQWGEDLVTSWNKHAWIDLPFITAKKIAPLIGAHRDQVVVCDSVSVNLFKLLACALSLRPGRLRILTQQNNFPTDLYIADGLSDLLKHASYRVEKVPVNRLADALDNDVAVLLLTHVDFRSGHMHDMQRLTQAAHAAGALTVWDLAHSAGALPIALDDWEVDFAVGCGYKYLNGGPGAPAFVYAAARHHNALSQPLQGWMGHAAPFDFAPDYRPRKGIAQFLSGTPPIISMAALDGALSAFDGIDMTEVRIKSIALAELLISQVESPPTLKTLKLASPRSAEARGSHLCFQHEQAYEIVQALIDLDVVTDFRAPDLIRIGLTPLYTRFEDIWHCVDRLQKVMVNKLYAAPQYASRKSVT